MANVVYTDGDFVVRECEKGFVLINMNGEYKNHGHIKSLKTAKMLIRLMRNKTVPNSDYLRGTVLRVSLDSDYKNKVLHKIEKDKNKPYFININKGIKK